MPKQTLFIDLCVIGSNASIDNNWIHFPSSHQSPNMEQQGSTAPPHLVALPFPAEGHIKPMFCLTKLLSHKGHRITFVNAQHIHNRLLQYTDLPDFRFTFVADGLPHDLSPNDFSVTVSPTSRSKVAEEFREMLRDLVENPSQWGPPSCIIVDGMMSTVAMDAARDLWIMKPEHWHGYGYDTDTDT